MDREGKIVRNQIDFILAGLTLRKHIKFVKIYPGADVNSNHNLVIMDFRFKKFSRKTKMSEKSI